MVISTDRDCEKYDCSTDHDCQVIILQSSLTGEGGGGGGHLIVLLWSATVRS